MSRSLLTDQGPVVDRPAAGQEGRFWWATDEGVAYIDTGTEWERVPAVPPPPPDSVYVIGGSSSSTVGVAVEAYDVSAGTWVARAPLPAARSRGASARNPATGLIHVVGGSDDAGNPTATHWSYDVGADAWTVLAPLPAARNYVAGAWLEGKFYIPGGNNAGHMATLYAYDPQPDSWASLAPLTEGVYGAGVASVGGLLYVAGGSTAAVAGGSKVVQVYDPSTDTWGYKTSMVSGRWALTLAEVGGLLYATAGASGGSNVSAHEEYDPAADTWTARAQAPTTSQHGRAVIDGSLYVFSGNPSGSTTFSEYDPATDTWLGIGLPSSRGAGVMGAAGTLA